MLVQVQDENLRLTDEVAALREQVGMLEKTVTELESEIEVREDALANLEVRVVDGYFVHLWQEDGCWAASCPSVGANVVLDDHDATLAGIAEDMEEMIEALAELGQPAPEKDITC